MKVHLCIPAYGSGLLGDFVTCVLRGIMSRQIANVTILPGDSLVSRARNNLAATFLSGDADALLFIDSDIVFTPDDIARAIERNQPILCGLYPIKKPTLEWVVNTLGDEVKPDDSGLWEIKYGGTGFMLIQRDVFRQMQIGFPEIEYTDDICGQKRWDFFSVGVTEDTHMGQRRYFSEDWYFCERWRRLGGKIYADTRIQLGHIGQSKYPMQYPKP